ncbi:MAG: helix-turn-helix domain-containing protein [Prevotella sp.]|jgi:transcriptional regulator with XRE-family HTH domain|nr:helix-turn-helix domain-containing protein [Prevotella sp.]
MTSRQNIIGKRLQALRKSKKLTQAQIVARCALLGWDITENTITKVETEIRCVTDYELLILAQALKVKLKDIFPTHPSLF